MPTGDGFGDPASATDGPDPELVLHHLLHILQARTGQMAVVIIQQLCDRGTLDAAIRKHCFREGPTWSARLARRALLRTAAELARGLQHLHCMGVVHGDLKPANVLLLSSKDDRRGFTVKVTDFGLSHVLPPLNSFVTTQTWGSPGYMAPEAFSGKVSRATDVWAFGVCLWEMLTGNRPYAGVKASDVVVWVQQGSLKLRWPEGADDMQLSQLGRRCLSFAPEGRPTFNEIVEELVLIERTIRAGLLAENARQAPDTATVAPQ
ncbi:hypothetical protein GPECTOR_17g906 [Gonium pectorale]|uniref:Protein kinase domain-containing protein n=1 Tax=Gonium pectorale TaxID=33097 RepID=A0A150GKF2_GONPE|nr:hypothetical protein GPECTOR_17g906 [Gonium pectorale]|eukprot:KXZ50267.1 hypothetical protein GPECTOR_17g906 [Gonium pectorale]